VGKGMLAAASFLPCVLFWKNDREREREREISLQIRKIAGR